jgi:pilus assembly protein CpaB
MKVARVVVLGIALVAGVAAALIAMNLSRPAPVREASKTPVQTIPTIGVLVAKSNIGIGTKIDTGMLDWRPWPANGLSATYITDKDHPNATTELAGTIAKGSFIEGEPITEAKLVHTDSGYMSAILPSGKVAVATAINADTGAGGFILPNDRVDVIMTRSISSDANGGGGDRYDTETILNNVRVLAIDQQIEEKNGEKVVVGQTATLELTPEQAQILTVARQVSARLALALRSLADAEDHSGKDAIHLIGGASSGTAITVVKNGVSTQTSVNQ